MVDGLVASGGESESLVFRLAAFLCECALPSLEAFLLLRLRLTEGKAVNVDREGYPARAEGRRRDLSRARARHPHAHRERSVAFRNRQDAVDTSAAERGHAHAEYGAVRSAQIRRRSLLHGGRDFAFEPRPLVFPVRLEVVWKRRERTDFVHAEDHAVQLLAHAVPAQVDAKRAWRRARELKLERRLLRHVHRAPPHDVRPAVVCPRLYRALRPTAFVRDRDLHRRRGSDRVAAVLGIRLDAEMRRRAAHRRKCRSGEHRRGQSSISVHIENLQFDFLKSIKFALR